MGLELTGKEALDDFYEYILVIDANQLKADQLLGLVCSVVMEKNAQGEKVKTRYFNGYCVAINEIFYKDEKDKYSLKITISPFTWFLTKNNAYRVFQNKKAQDIILNILEKYKFKEKTEFTVQNDPVINYCIQYAESDWEFILRLTETRGWGFLFKQEKDNHTLCFYENDISFTEFKDIAITPHYVISDWERDINLPFLYADAISYDYEKAITVQAGVCKSSKEINGNRPEGQVIYPGEFKTKDEAIEAAKSLMGSEDQRSFTAHGKSEIMSFAPGVYFTFDKFKDEPEPLLIWETEHKIAPPEEDEVTLEYSNTFTCCKKGKKWYSKKASSPPTLPPLQIARVTGSENEGIFSNEKNQVKIQFAWDTEGKYDDNSSCWVNVQSPVAGEGSGIRVTPNIGDDVLVGFTADYTPLILGSIYSGDKKAPFDKITQQGLRFRSVPDGGENDYSALCFNCKSGEETIVFQSIRDMLKEVKRNDETFVEGDRVVTVKGGLSQYTEKDTLFSTSGNAKNQVKGDHYIEVSGDQQSFLAGLSYVKASGNYQLECDKNIEMTSSEGTAISSKTLVLSSSQNAIIKAGNSKIAITDSMIELNCGSQSIVISNSGITINGQVINISASTQAIISGLNTSINSQTSTSMNGTIINISGKAQTNVNGGGMLSLNGGITQINCSPGGSPPPPQRRPPPPPPPPSRPDLQDYTDSAPGIPSAGDLPVEEVLATYEPSEKVLAQAQPGMTVNDLLDRLEERGEYKEAMELQHRALDTEDSILLGYHSVTDGAGSMEDFMHGTYSFVKGIPDFFTKDVPDFFTKDIPDFFTKDIPDFFTKGVPDFFTKDIPDYFTKDRPNSYHKRYVNRLDDYRRRGEQYRDRFGDYGDRFDDYRRRAGGYRDRFDDYRSRAGRYRDRFNDYRSQADGYSDRFNDYRSQAEGYRDSFNVYGSQAEGYRDSFNKYHGQASDYLNRFNNYETPDFFSKKPMELFNKHFPNAFSDTAMPDSKVDLLKKQYLKNYNSSDLPNLAVAQKYLSNPSAENRQQCLLTSLKSKKTTAGNLLLKGIGLSGDSVTFPDSVSVPTPPKIHAPLIAGAVQMAAETAKTKTPEEVYKNGCKAGRILLNNQKGRKEGMTSAEKFSDAKACLIKHGIIGTDNPINKASVMNLQKAVAGLGGAGAGTAGAAGAGTAGAGAAGAGTAGAAGAGAGAGAGTAGAGAGAAGAGAGAGAGAAGQPPPSLSSIIDDLPPESKPDLPLKNDTSISNYVSSLMAKKQYSQAATTLCFALPPKDAVSVVHSQINKNDNSLMVKHIDHWLKTQDKDSLKSIKKEILKTPATQPNYMLGQVVLLSSNQKENQPETPVTKKLKAANSKLLADTIAIAALSQKNLLKDIATSGLALLNQKKPQSIKIPKALKSPSASNPPPASNPPGNPATQKTINQSVKNTPKRALDVIRKYKKIPDQGQLPLSETCEDHITSQQKNGLYKDAILFISHALEPLPAVFWCYTCICQANLQLSEVDLNSLHAVHDFILQPTNDKRKICGKAVAKNLTDTPCSWLSRSAYWCFGEISPDGEDGSEPVTVVAPHHYSYAVNSAMNALASDIAPDKQKHAYNDWIDFALTFFKSK